MNQPSNYKFTSDLKVGVPSQSSGGRNLAWVKTKFGMLVDTIIVCFKIQMNRLISCLLNFFCPKVLQAQNFVTVKGTKICLQYFLSE